MRGRFVHLLAGLLLSLLLFREVSARDGADTLRLQGGDWQAWVDARNGTLIRYERRCADRLRAVPFRMDKYAGPRFESVELRPGDDSLSFCGQRGRIRYELRYRLNPDHPILECRITNEGTTPYAPPRERLILGVDSEMSHFPEWDAKFFPTLLRCERDFAWGYFMSPQGDILAFATEDPVASYGLNYQYAERLEWLWGHRIHTASLDLLHEPPLPARHPQQLDTLSPGTSRRWVLHLGIVESPEEVKPAVARWSGGPQIEADRYCLCAGERIGVNLFSGRSIRNIRLESDAGEQFNRQVRIRGGNTRIEMPALRSPGTYRLQVSTDDKTAEALLHVHQPWSWYLRRARDFVAAHPPGFGSSCETFYGYYPAFLGARHFPDPRADSLLQARFLRDLPLMIDTLNGRPRSEEVLPWRVQNFSTLMGQLVDLWEATSNRRALTFASRIGDYLLSEEVQAPDSAYRARGVHYSAVIYPAKSLFELADAEMRAGLQEEARRHYASAGRACEDLRRRLDDIQTEGDMTFEDGMITCSALQMALCTLHCADSARRNTFTQAARRMMEKHRCLEQRLIPDCRMRGATLRFWEALDVYFVPNQVMNSPHGWSAWKIYAVCYLYLLTGDTSYLDDLLDTTGACLQLMSPEGKLRWAFLPDPHVRGRVCLPGREPRSWEMRDSVVGEQYLGLVSPWMRSLSDTGLCFFGEFGGAGDHTVYEIFKALEECLLTTAYVVVPQTGEIRSHNCTVRRCGRNVLEIRPDEACVQRVHLNSARELTVRVLFPEGRREQKIPTGMTWIGENPYPGVHL